MAKKSGWRRRLKRGALAAVISIAVVAIVVFCLPLPIGWAINLGAARAMPPGLGLKAHVASGTFHWRLGNDTARLEIAGIVISVKGLPLGSVGSLVVEVDKAAARHGYYAPRLVAITAPLLIVDATPNGALSAVMLPDGRPAATAKESAPMALMALAPLLPAPGGTTRLRIEGGRVDYIFSEMKWSLVGRTEANLVRTGDDVHLEVEGNLGAPDHPLGGNAKVDLALRTGKIGFAISLPELKTAELPPLPMGKLPVDGTVSLGLGGEWDFNARELLSSTVDFSFRDGHLTLPGIAGLPVAIEQVILRGRATQRAGEHGKELWGQIERGLIAVEGARLEIRKLEGAFSLRSQVEWDVELSTVAGARIAPRLPNSLPVPPWLAHAVEESALNQWHSKGTATIVRDAAGALVLQEVDATHQLKAAIADESLEIDAAARQRNGAPVETTVRVKPLELGKLARAFPSEWSLAAAAFPIGIEVRGRVTPSGRLLEVNTRVEMGAGELRSIAPLNRAVPIRRVVLEALMHENAEKWDVSSLSVETGLGALELRNVAVQRDRLHLGATGHLALREIPFAPWADLVPAAALASLRSYGLALDDFALRNAEAEFAVDLGTKTGTDWHPAKAEVTADLELGFGGKPLALHLAAHLPDGGSEATAQVALKEFRPSDFGPRSVAGFALADFRFPIRVEGEARVRLSDLQLQSSAARVRLGAGEAHLAALKTTLPFRSVSIDGEFDPVKNVARVSSARVELAAGVEVGVDRMTMDFAPPLRFAGVAKLANLSLRDAMAWWPADFMPDVRQQAATAVGEGKLRTDGIDFEMDFGGKAGALRATRARGGIVLSELALQLPHVPGSTTISELNLRADYPRADVLVKNLRGPGFVVELAKAAIEDVMAVRPAATAEATFTLDASAAGKWLESLPSSPALAQMTKSKGEVKGVLSVRTPLSASDFSSAKLALTLTAEKLVVPDTFDGPFQAKLDVTAPSRSTLMVEASLAVASARVMALDRPVGASPFSLTLTLRDWNSGDSPTAEGALSVADLGGYPLRLKGTAQFAAHGQTLVHAEVPEFVFGHTELQGEWHKVGVGHNALNVAGRKIDVSEIATAAAPWIDLLSPPLPAPVPPATAAPVPPRVGKGVVIAPTAKPTSELKAAVAQVVASPPKSVSASVAEPARLDFKLEVAEMEFGNARRLKGVMASAALENNWPQSARFEATEAERNLISVMLTPDGGKQHLKVVVADTAALARTLTEPLRIIPRPRGKFGEMAKSAADIPTLLAGGAINLEGEVRQVAAGLEAKGNFLLSDATMIQAPRILQLLALRSGKSLERSPLIRRLAVGEWSMDPDRVEVKTFTLEGTGLIDRLKLNSIRYTFAGEKVAVDGAYFGVGFEVIGTRSDPQVFLKDNALIRTIGQKNEFDFFGDEKESTPAKKK